jgi:CheY-like chemotaxis protein
MPKLLLADDSATIQRVIELTFSREDMQVVVVGDGEAAIARIPIELPDIVLADIAMPRRSGYEVAAFVKGRPDLAQIPVVLLAGAFEAVDAARAEALGCDGVLVKPFEPSHVIARVRALIDGRRGPSLAVAADDAPSVVVLAPADGLDTYLHRIDEAFSRIEQGPRAQPSDTLITVDAVPVVPVAAMSLSVDESLDDFFERLNLVAAGPSPSREDVIPDDRLDDAPPLTLAELVPALDGPVFPRAVFDGRSGPEDARWPRIQGTAPYDGRLDRESQRTERMADALDAVLRDEAVDAFAADPREPLAGLSEIDPRAEAIVHRVLGRLMPQLEDRIRRLVHDELGRATARAATKVTTTKVATMSPNVRRPLG